MPRKPMTQDEVNAVRERACLAATDLFTEYGSAEINMWAVASRVGMSAMAPYRYFPGAEPVGTAANFDRNATDMIGCSR